MNEDIVRLGEEYAKKGNLVELDKIIHQLSANNLLNESLYLSAYSQFLRGKLSDALSLCEKITPSPSISKDKKLLCKIFLLKSRILQRHGEYTNSNRALDRCFTLIRDEDHMLGEIWNSKGVNYWMLGRLEEAKQCYRKARHLAKKTKRMSLFLKSCINLGIVPLRQGNFFEANIYLQNALELCQKEKENRLQIYAMLNLGELYWQRGDWEMGMDLLLKCSQLAKESALIYEEGASYWIFGSILRDEHNFDKASEFYNKALGLLERSISYTERLYVYLNIGVLERIRGDYQKSLDFLSRAQSIMNETGEKLDEGYLFIEMGFVLWFLGEKLSSLKYLKKGLEKTKNRKYEQTIGRFFLHYIQGKKDVEHFRDFDNLLKICWKNGYDTILVRERDTLLPLLCEYLSKKKRAILPRMILFRLVTKYENLIDFLLNQKSLRCQEVALSLIEKLGLQRFKDEVQKRIWDLRPKIAQKAISVLETLEQKHMPYLKINLFGKFEVTKNNHITVFFPRKKVRDLFKILLVHYKKTILREQLMEILWPDESPMKSFNSLRQLIFLLRKTLQEYGFDAANMILRETGLYEFRYPQQRLEVDLFSFKKHIQQGDVFWNSGNENEAIVYYKNAFELYQGSLFVENLYDEWTETHRLEARDMYVRVISRICSTLKKTSAEKAEDFIRDALKKEPELSNIAQKQH